MSLKKTSLFLVGLLIALVALVAAGCGGSGGGSAPEALPSSSCTAIEYEGDGNPDYLLVSDLPLQGASRTQTLQINDAIRFELKKADYKAGDYKIGFQACDDATAQAGKWDSGKCSQNANAYAANDKVVGIIGTFNSGCAGIIIPVVNQAPDGGIAMLSPANTYVCLTQGGPGCDKTEPDKYYPSGTRNYARVVANDGYQGAADAEFSQSIGVKNVYILNDKEAYGLGVATNYQNAAKSLGIKIAGFGAFDPKASSYEALFNNIKATGADAVFIGGLICENGAQLIKDKVAVLGPNDGAVKLITPDGFATQQTIDDAGSASAGMYMSVAGQPIDKFQGEARDVRDGLLEAVPEREDDRPVRHLRRPGGHRDAERDRCVRRLTQRRDLEDVRQRRPERPARIVQVQRERRSAGGERSSRRHHGLQGDGQARDRQGHLAEAVHGRRSARPVERMKTGRGQASVWPRHRRGDGRALPSRHISV